MKNVLNFKYVARMALAATLMVSMSAHAIVDISKVPSIQLQQAVPGSSTQAVEDIPDKSKLTVFYNDLLLQQNMNLPGWDASTKNRPDNKGILDAFAIRTTQDPAKVQANNSLFYAGRGVGRSGVWEKQANGDAFAYIDGRPLKGLTIKGYGGNAGKSYQPDGSLEASEAYRDTVLSKILMEKGADTYIGALAVVRPKASGEAQANYIRLSRSTLRMNDLIDRKGADLRATVDHLSQIVTDELGKKPTAAEFADWIVLRSARTLAHKEHARVTASNHNKDNFGIAELVDFGEAKYDPFNYKHGYDVVGNGNSTWSGGLKPHILEAAQNIAAEYGFQKDFKAMFEKTYSERVQTLISRDAARVSLDTASKKEMKDIGLSDLTIERIEHLRAELAFGLLSTEDVLSKVSMQDSEKKLIRERTTTHTMKMADGHIVPNALLTEIGGTDGLREILTGTMKDIPHTDLANEQKVREKVAAKIKEKMSALGTNKYPTSWGGYGANIEGNLSLHLGKKISANADVWTGRYAAALKLKTLGAVMKCDVIF